ncbi:MAG: DUF86 domain-containing protein [Halobacteriales archaeon]|nr:DUF86 domain-containing protein [Halobacteriales archaeon]
MDARRERRYRDKLQHADEALRDVQAWLGEAATDRKSRRAVYKAFQEACEAATDLAAMVLVDAGLTAKDDYTNLDAAEKVLGLAGGTRHLKEATGLRNRLVHEYNGLDDGVALAAMRELEPVVRDFLEEVERWLTSRA